MYIFLSEIDLGVEVPDHNMYSDLVDTAKRCFKVYTLTNRTPDQSLFLEGQDSAASQFSTVPRVPWYP